MIRNLKALGLALVAVFAMSAIVATAAQAEKPAEFTAAEYPAFIDGEQIEGVHTFTAGPFTVTCEFANFESNEVKVANTELTLIPTYTNCHVIVGKTFPATVTMNGCDYVFTGTKDKNGEYTAITDVVCPVGAEIEVHIYKEAPHNAETSMCTLTVKPKTGLAGITLTNMAGPPTDVKATIKVTLPYTRDIGPQGNALTCGAASGNSTYEGKATLRATKPKGMFGIGASVSG